MTLKFNEFGSVRIKLRNLEGKISKRLYYKKVKHDLRPTPPPIDLSDYAGEEPLALELKVVPQKADIPIDETGPITYEKYRALPAQ